MTQPTTSAGERPRLELSEVTFVRDGRRILAPLSWRVGAGEAWVVLGRNGSGKTTLVRIGALREHPSSGWVEVGGQRLGRVDIRLLRPRVGFASPAMLDLFRPTLTAEEVVVTARHDALEPWWHRYEAADHSRARDLLGQMGVAHTADRPLITLSSGERQRVLLARVQMTDPDVVLLDEPTAGLDLGGREDLVAELDSLAGRQAMALVTHHVEEIPSAFTHALLIRDGEVLTSGPIEETLTEESLSECFGMTLHLERRADRFTAWRD